MVEGLPHHLKVYDWVMNNPWKMADSYVDKNRMKLDKMNLKGMVWKVVEEIFNSTNMEEVKWKLGVLIEEAINAIHRDGDIMVESLDRRKEDEKLRMEGKDEQPGLFLEEELFLSMLHKDQGVSSSLICVIESSLVLESSG